MRWTSENDQILLVKILETHPIGVDAKKVQEAWPQKNGEKKPTARAISERLSKIKNLAKENGVTPKKGDSKSPASSRKRKTANDETPVSKRPCASNKTEIPEEPDHEKFKSVKEEKENGWVLADCPPEDVFLDDSAPRSLRIGDTVIYKEEADDDGLRNYETTDSEFVA